MRISSSAPNARAPSIIAVRKQSSPHWRRMTLPKYERSSFCSITIRPRPSSHAATAFTTASSLPSTNTRSPGDGRALKDPVVTGLISGLQPMVIAKNASQSHMRGRCSIALNVRTVSHRTSDSASADVSSLLSS